MSIQIELKLKKFKRRHKLLFLNEASHENEKSMQSCALY